MTNNPVQFLTEDDSVQLATHATVEFPPTPSSIQETGLSRALLTRLIVKALYVMGELTEASVGQQLKLPYSITKEILTSLCKEKYCEIKGFGDGVGLMYRYVLTDLGLARAQEYMDTSHYVGAAPVTLSHFQAMVDRQSALKRPFTRPMLEKALRNLVLPRQVCDQLGGAVNSGTPIFLYGNPGNGKTIIAEAIGDLLSGEGGGETLIPYAIEVDEQIIEIFDPSVHATAENTDDRSDAPDRPELKQQYDKRWVLCRRPTVFTGGELTLPMLDLCFNPISKYYAAPPQLKASGGVFIIDDFGRQQVPPQALLNRWIVPLEKRVDYLTLHTGKKFQVPFDTLVVIGTNIEPRKLVDEAFLRRMRNKIFVGDPTAEDYLEIFRRYCEKYGIAFEARAVDYVHQQYYSRYGIPPRGCHPRDLIEQIMSIAKFYDIPPSLEPWFLDRACQNYLLLDQGAGGA